jgi:hypothetical protein
MSFYFFTLNDKYLRLHKLWYLFLLQNKSSIHRRLSFPKLHYLSFYQNQNLGLWKAKMGSEFETVLGKPESLSILLGSGAWTRISKPRFCHGEFKEALTVQSQPDSERPLNSALKGPHFGKGVATAPTSETPSSGRDSRGPLTPSTKPVTVPFPSDSPPTCRLPSHDIPISQAFS